MSHATEAATTLHETVATAHAGLVASVSAYASLPKPWDADDIIASMQATARLHLAALDVAGAAKATATAARDALQAAFADTGCPAVDIEGFRVTAQDGHRLVRITDPKAVPHNLTIQPPTPPRAPDIETIRKLLIAGGDVAGCELISGKPSVRFSQRAT